MACSVLGTERGAALALVSLFLLLSVRESSSALTFPRKYPVTILGKVTCDGHPSPGALQVKYAFANNQHRIRGVAEVAEDGSFSIVTNSLKCESPACQTLQLNLTYTDMAGNVITGMNGTFKGFNDNYQVVTSRSLFLYPPACPVQLVRPPPPPSSPPPTRRLSKQASCKSGFYKDRKRHACWPSGSRPSTPLSAVFPCTRPFFKQELTLLKVFNLDFDGLDGWGKRRLAISRRALTAYFNAVLFRKNFWLTPSQVTDKLCRALEELDLADFGLGGRCPLRSRKRCKCCRQ